MKKEKRLGYFFYIEWLKLPLDYFVCTKKRELFYEVGVPIVISFLCVYKYFQTDLIHKALAKMGAVLPTVMSILIGFTVMMITLLLASDGKNIEQIKEKKAKSRDDGRQISLFQALLIQFTHSLFSETILLLIVFAYLFLNGINRMGGICGVVFLGIETYYVLNILLSILRGMTNLYFTFFSSCK